MRDQSLSQEKVGRLELSEPVVNEETRSMRFAIGINLLMAVAGTLTSWLCNAQALALDGLVSGLNALMILIAERLSRQLSRPADRRYPFGYWSLETLCTGSRSLVLLGMIVYAVIVSIARILCHLQGAVVAVPFFGGIVIYSMAMVALCLLMAGIHHRHWLRGGRQSPLLVMERRAALVDGWRAQCGGWPGLCRHPLAAPNAPGWLRAHQ